MIVIISDLHLQHTSRDGIRRIEHGQVLETRVIRNVSAGALALLFSEIASNATRTHATEVHLVFAGDIFELHRTPLWLLSGETLRPTLHPAVSSPELEHKVLSILAAIERDNHRFFEALAAFVANGELRHRGADQTLQNVAVVPHFLPGNHDRLVAAWPSTRACVRRLLCLPPSTDGTRTGPFPHQLDWTRAMGYGLRVRHGHEYDPTNFSAAFDPTHATSNEVYQAPALGDFVTVDVATRLAVAFRAHYARELRATGATGDTHRRVYAALTEFDDVRPQSMLVHYLNAAVGANQAAVFAILRPVLRDAFETAAADAFFVSEAERLGFGQYFQGRFAPLVLAALENLDGSQIGELLSAVDNFHHGQRGAGPAAIAQKELGLASGETLLIVAGHTHEPDHVALPSTTNGEAYFLDTGTWRTRIDAGVSGAFGRLRSYTMVFCYHDRELLEGEGRRFESWTGHLQAADYGPKLSAAVEVAVRPALQQLRFETCRIAHIDEGETHDGAELVLYFGVDALGQKLLFEHVHDGTTLALSDAPLLSIDPVLDGEVWCYGVEKDLGDSVLDRLDRDDPLPWAVTFLARVNEEPNAPFARSAFELRASDNRGNAFTLSGRVL